MIVMFSKYAVYVSSGHFHGLPRALKNLAMPLATHPLLKK